MLQTWLFGILLPTKIVSFSFNNILRRELVKKKFNYYNTDVTMQFLA